MIITSQQICAAWRAHVQITENCVTLKSPSSSPK